MRKLLAYWPVFLVLLICCFLFTGCGKAGMHRNDLSSWKRVSIDSVNLSMELPEGVKVEELKYNDYRTPGKENAAYIKMHKWVPGGFAEYRYILTFIIRRFSKKEWQFFVDTFVKGTPKLMAQPNHEAIKISKEVVIKKKNRLLTYCKDIVTSKGEVIRIKATLQLGFDPTHEKDDENTLAKIIKSMKPIRK